MLKPSNCPCPGRGYRDKGDRWVVIERRDGKSSGLKCLKCGWKWYSKCKYVAKLPDHVERSQSGMTDAGILERLNDGSLWVDPRSVVVTSTSKHYPNGIVLKVIERESRGSTYQFVEVCLRGKKKKIALHRLVWMSVHRKLVPDGYDVHHIKGKEGGNGIDNLELIGSGRNRSRVIEYEEPF